MKTFLLAIVVLGIALPFVFALSPFPSDINPTTSKFGGLGRSRGRPDSTPLDLNGEWLGDYDATANTNFIKVIVDQDDSGFVLGYFESNNQVTFNVTLTGDDLAAQGTGILFKNDIPCATVSAGMYISDNNHFTFVWGAASDVCDGIDYPGQTGEFFRNLSC